MTAIGAAHEGSTAREGAAERKRHNEFTRLPQSEERPQPVRLDRMRCATPEVLAPSPALLETSLGERRRERLPALLEDHRLLAGLYFTVLESAGALADVEDGTGGGTLCVDKPEAAGDRAFANLARKIGRLMNWREKFWSRRYQAIVISPEAAAQVERLKYVLAHGVKEGLVEKVLDWPGVHCAQALLTGEAVQGYWFDGTQEYAARRRGEEIDRMRFATLEELTLSPLPCWKHLSGTMRRRLIADLIAEIEAEAAIRRQNQGRQVLGASAVRGQHPFDRPAKPKRSPAPLFHAASKAVRLELYAAYRWFVTVFREASEKLRDGDRTAKFPVGSFPPALPFVAG